MLEGEPEPGLAWFNQEEWQDPAGSVGCGVAIIVIVVHLAPVPLNISISQMVTFKTHLNPL